MTHYRVNKDSQLPLPLRCAVTALARWEWRPNPKQSETEIAVITLSGNITLSKIIAVGLPGMPLMEQPRVVECEDVWNLVMTLVDLNANSRALYIWTTLNFWHYVSVFLHILLQFLHQFWMFYPKVLCSSFNQQSILSVLVICLTRKLQNVQLTLNGPSQRLEVSFTWIMTAAKI